MEISRIREFIKLMDEHGLVEMEIESEGFTVKLRKAASGVTQIVPAAAPVTASPSAASAAPPAAEAGAAPAPAAKEGVDIIRSPMVGTFYRAPSPEEKAFVDVGAPVDEDTLVCIVEAMKVMNEVRAEVVGTITKVLVEDGKPVEFGQPLFEVMA